MSNARELADVVNPTGAANVGFAPVGGISATNVQAAIAELDSEAAKSAALAAAGGSALVGFLQAGSGAVVRTAQAKMRDVVSVKDFGAVGDGVTDDTAAMNAAAAAAGVQKKALFVPSGVYKMTAPWVVPIKVYVLGESMSVQDAYDPANAWLYGAIIYKAHTGNGITKTGAGAYDEGAPIENITISSHRTNFPAGNGFVLDQCGGCHLIRCNVFGVGGDCYVLGVTAGDVTGHNYVFNCYSNNPVGVHYRVRQKWGRFHYPVTDGGTHGMYLDNAPETHVDGFHFEGFTVAAVRCANANQSSRFVGKGFVGNTANALYGFILDNVVGNNNIAIENVKFQGPSGLANSVGVSVGVNAINTRIQGCEFNQWATAIDNNASFSDTKSWVINCTFFSNGLCIRSNAGNSEYSGNQFDSTTGSFDISHVSGSKGLWTGNVFGKSINPVATGVQGNFNGICVKNNSGYVSRNSGTTTTIAPYTNIAHGLAGTPKNAISVLCNSSGVTSAPQLSAVNATNFQLYWTGTTPAQRPWEALPPFEY